MDNQRRTARRGDTFLLVLQVWRDLTSGALTAVDPFATPPPNAVPQDLTAAHVAFTLKSTVVDSDGQALARLDNAALGGVAVLASPSMLKVTLPAQVTVTQPDGPVELQYDVQVVLGALVQTVDSGVVVLGPDVTRAIA